jgi:hypothetical protein
MTTRQPEDYSKPDKGRLNTLRQGDQPLRIMRETILNASMRFGSSNRPIPRLLVLHAHPWVEQT